MVHPTYTTRNRGCVPHLENEGEFSKPLGPIELCERDDWYHGLSPFKRMYMHQTLANARRFANFHPFSGLVPRDALDLVLSSNYDHATEIFPESIDVYFQPETIGYPTWRRLKNTKEIKIIADARVKEDGPLAVPLKSELAFDRSYTGHIPKHKRKIPYKYNFAHPVLIGGIMENRHPSHIKLMNSSHHSPQTNAGYSRQGNDGNLFQY